MRSFLLRSIDSRKGEVLVLLAMVLIIVIGALYSAALVVNERLEQEVVYLIRELESLEEENRLLKQELEELQELNRELQDLHKDIEEIKGILEGAREREMLLTAYAPLDPRAVEGMCYSGDPNITASGAQVVPGVTVAAGREIPFGTRVWIEGFGMRVVQDRGGRIGSDNLDMAVETRAEAFQVGRQRVRVLVF